MSNRLGIVGIVAIIAAIFITGIVAVNITKQEKELDGRRDEFKVVFINACIKGGGDVGQTEGFYEYCGCAFDEYEKITGDWRKIPAHSEGQSDEDRIEELTPCFYHLQG